MNTEIEAGLYMVKIRPSKVKHKSDLEKAFSKIQLVAEKHGFSIKLKEMIYDSSDVL